MSLPSVLTLAGSGTSETVNLFDSNVQITSPTTVAKTIYTLPAGTLARNGDSISYDIAGAFDGANDTVLIVAAAGAAVLNTGVIDPTNDAYVLRGRMVRVSGSALKVSCTLVGSGLSVAYISSIGGFDFTTELAFSVEQQGTDGLKIEMAHITFSAGE